jgi:hypothetical protein
MKVRTCFLPLAIVLGVLLMTGVVVAGPRLSLREVEFDFGFAPQNAKISHVFWLLSTGTDSLKILQVNPG